MNKNLQVLMITLIASGSYGCAAFSSTPDELIQNTKHAERYCYDQVPVAVAVQIEAFLMQCFGKGGMETMVGAGDTYVPITIEEPVVLRESSGKEWRYSIVYPVGD